MAIAKIHNTLDTDYSQAYTRRNRTSYPNLDWDLSGVPNPSISGMNNVYDKNRPPFALGSGVYVTTAGRWLLNPEYGPALSFVVINGGSADIYAGINATASGQWGVGSGITIAANSSYEFGGEPGAAAVRNVWAMAATGSQLVQGYSTLYRDMV